MTKKSKFGSVSMRFQSKKNPNAKSIGNLNIPVGGSRSSSARTSQGTYAISHYT